MKKLFFIFPIALFVLFGFSCRKDLTDGRINTISADIAGKKISFNESAKAWTPSVYNNGIKISGSESIPGSSLEFIIVNPTTIATGTYTENTADTPLVQMSYVHHIDPFFFLNGTSISYSNYQCTTNPVVITITGISATSVKGTFKGELKGSDGPVEITNGFLNVSF